jgi:hypothetical protein
VADETNGWDVIKVLGQAASSLCLVYAGSWLATKSERRREVDKVKREQAFALAMMIAKLEQVALRCLEIAHDTGEPDPDSGQMYFRVKRPEVDLFEKGLDLSKLPADRLLKLLEIPHDQARIDQMIEEYAEHDDWDELRDTLWIRREAYASFGQRVLRIAYDLRELGDLPRGAQEGQWTLISDLERAEKQAREERQAYEGRNQGFLFGLDPAPPSN